MTNIAITSATATPPAPTVNISTAQEALLQQITNLTQASTPEALQTEIQRAKAMSHTAAALTGMARVQVEYMQKTSGSRVDFLEVPATTSPAPGVTTHRLR